MRFFVDANVLVAVLNREYYAARQFHCQVIVSEDVSDFYFSEIPVQDCATFLGDIAQR